MPAMSPVPRGVSAPQSWAFVGNPGQRGTESPATPDARGSELRICAERDLFRPGLVKPQLRT